MEAMSLIAPIRYEIKKNKVYPQIRNYAPI